MPYVICNFSSTFLVASRYHWEGRGNGLKIAEADGQPAIEAQLDSPTGVAVDLFLGRDGKQHEIGRMW